MKSKLLIVLAVLPLVGFCDGVVTPSHFRLFVWTGFDQVVRTSGSKTYQISSDQDLYSILSTSVFGIKLELKATTTSSRILLPYTSDPVQVSGVSNLTITNSVLCLSNGVNYAYSVFAFPSSASVYFSAANLYLNGYRGVGIQSDFVNSTKHCVNIDYPLLVADVLSSTNTLFRQLLLSSLSSINQSVINIDSGVTQLQPVLTDIRDLNTSISSNSAQTSALLADSLPSIQGNLSSIDLSSGLSASNSGVIASSSVATASNVVSIADSASAVSDNTAAIVSSSSLSVSNTAAIASSSSIAADNTSHIADNTSTLPGELYNLNSSVYGFKDLFSNPYSLFSSAAQYGRAALAGDPSSWRPDPNNPFFPYDPNNIDDPNHPLNPNSPLNPQSPNFIGGGGAFGAFTTNQVMRPITNAVVGAGREVSSNVVQAAQDTRDLLNDTLLNPDYDGVNVRIKFPIYGQHQQAVNVHDEAFDIYGSSIESLNQNVGDLLGNQSSYWQQLFNRWDRDLPEVTNLVGLIYNFLLTNSTARTLNTLLLDDYSDYVSNGFYKVAMLNFADDYPSTYSNLVALGLNVDGSGNLWSLHGSSLAFISSMVHSNNTMVASVLGDLAAIDQEFENHLGKTPLQAFKDTLSAFPSPTDVEDTLNRVSDNTNDVLYAYADFESSLVSVSNTYDSVFKPFNGRFDTVPSSDIVLFKMANEQYVTIPVSDQPRAWEIIRVGFSFALVAVNIVLFPKYLLMVFLLFIKAFQRGIKFFPDDR